MKRIAFTLISFGALAFMVAISFTSPRQVVALSSSPLHRFAACSTGSGALPEAIFVPWYKYLDSEGSGKDCKPKVDGDYVGAASKIGLAVLDTLTRLAGVLALGYVLYGSIQYITSQGSQNGVAAAKSTITNAIAGLVVALLAIGFVQFIGSLVR